MRLEVELKKRKYLDEYFKTPNCRRDIRCIRDFCISRLVAFAEWNSSRENEPQQSYDGSFPTDTDLHLTMFFHYMFDKHPMFDFTKDWIVLFDQNYKGGSKDVRV
jgi:hypothetical protein